MKIAHHFNKFLDFKMKNLIWPLNQNSNKKLKIMGKLIKMFLIFKNFEHKIDEVLRPYFFNSMKFLTKPVLYFCKIRQS